MAGNETETPAAPADTPDEDKLVDRVVTKVLAALSPRETEGTSGETASMAAEIQRELAKLREAEARQRADDERAAKVDALSSKVDAFPERKPREFRKPTEFMGWATEDDR